MIRQLMMLVFLCLATAASAEPLVVNARVPDNNAKGVCVDTHLTITFDHAPTIGKTGQIRIYDAADNKVVDTFDMSIPPVQQTYVIGGNNLHAYPIIVTGNSAVIYPHNNSLAYGKTYYVQMDAGVLSDGDAPFAGYSGNSAWKFSTKSAAPASGIERVTVAADGTGDFATVQGAVDFVPADNQKRIIIFIRKGIYTEIVAFNAKNNITFLGEDRKGTVIAYSNNNTFQPNANNPQGAFSGSSYRRGVFMGFNSTGVVLSNLTVHNTTPKGGSQAEAIVFKEVRNQTTPNVSQTILSGIDLVSFQDTLQITGKAFISDCYIEGDTDYMWGDGPCYFVNCHLRTLNNGTSFTQPRNPADHHGFVFVDCTFDGAPSVNAATLGNGSGMSETVLINCKMGTMLRPEGWRSNGAKNAEFNLTNISDGKPYDTSKWPAWVKHLDKEQDAELIKNYRNPTWVLGGWTPEVPAHAP